MTATIETKATGFLITGAVDVARVDDLEVRATVKGHTGRYDVTWSLAGGWWCSCPARTRSCSHVTAVRRVVRP